MGCVCITECHHLSLVSLVRLMEALDQIPIEDVASDVMHGVDR